jgi:hypothetical protein
MTSLDFEVVSIEDARRELDGDAKQRAEFARSARLAQDPGGVLLAATVAWLASLPGDVRPTRLAAEHPRIANGIGALWPSVARCREHLESLTADLHGSRKGFPFEIDRELAALKAHYAALHPDDPAARRPLDRGSQTRGT